MSALREELHHAVDSLPDSRLEPVLAMVRGNLPPGRSRDEALANMAEVERQLAELNIDIDAEIDALRDDPRG